MKTKLRQRDVGESVTQWSAGACAGSLGGGLWRKISFRLRSSAHNSKKYQKKPAPHSSTPCQPAGQPATDE